MLLGHIDTVPGDIPVRVERTPEGDCLFGRGSVDAKGPLATFVAAGARLGSGWAHAADLRLVVVGAVEEEAATSKGARAVAARFDGRREPVPDACVIGEPSRWYRATLGYKGRLLLELRARQPMAHTAGPDPGVATHLVTLWNWVTAHASQFNAGRDRVFDQLSPNLRHVVTSTTAHMDETVDAQLAWRLPLGFDEESLVAGLLAHTAAAIGAEPGAHDPAQVLAGAPVSLRGAPATIDLAFRGWERAWRGERDNALTRSFLAAIRSVETGARPGFVVKTGTSDLNVVGPLWRCPIVAYGPGDSALDHTPGEHVALSEYWQAIRVVEAMLRGYAGV